MDNGITAMTGMQPTPQTGITADGSYYHAMKIEDVVRGLGVGFLRILDPYDIPLMISTIREAYGYLSHQQTADSRQPSADSDQTSADSNQPSADSNQPSADNGRHRASSIEHPASSSSPHSADGSSNVEHRTLNVEQVLSLGPAVIIARRECVLNAKLKPEDICDVSDIEKNCIGCKQCIIEFECPAIVFDEEAKRVKIDDGLCVQCGMCLYACPKQEKGKKLQKQYGKHTTKKKPK